MAEAARPTSRTLRPVKADSRDWDTTRNLYIEGDNLEVLKILQESYLGAVKVIYLDPPYNTGNDFIYPDSFVMDRGVYHGASGYRDAEGKINFQRKTRFRTAGITPTGAPCSFPDCCWPAACSPRTASS